MIWTNTSPLHPLTLCSRVHLKPHGGSSAAVEAPSVFRCVLCSQVSRATPAEPERRGGRTRSCGVVATPQGWRVGLWCPRRWTKSLQRGRRRFQTAQMPTGGRATEMEEKDREDTWSEWMEDGDGCCLRWFLSINKSRAAQTDASRSITLSRFDELFNMVASFLGGKGLAASKLSSSLFILHTVSVRIHLLVDVVSAAGSMFYPYSVDRGDYDGGVCCFHGTRKPLTATEPGWHLQSGFKFGHWQIRQIDVLLLLSIMVTSSVGFAVLMASPVVQPQLSL